MSIAVPTVSGGTLIDWGTPGSLEKAGQVRWGRRVQGVLQNGRSSSQVHLLRAPFGNVLSSTYLKVFPELGP